MKTNKYLIIL